MLLLLVGLTLSLSVIGPQAFNSSSQATIIVLPHARNVFLESPQVLASMANTGTSLPIWPQGSNLTFVSVNATSLVLTWPNATALEYRINENEILLNTVQGNLTSYYVAGLDSRAIYIFDVEAGDGTSWTLPLSLTVNPSALTTQPLELYVPGPQSVQAGTALTFAVNATGPKVPTETVSISASGLPAGATFPQLSQGNPISATFGWSPTSSQGPGNYTITFQASDTLKSPSVTRTVLIHVTKARKAPVLTVPGPQALSPGSLLSFAVVAEDPNLPPSPVTVSAAGLPNGSSFNSTTGVFSWITTCDHALCVYILIFTAENQNGVVQKAVAITVNGSSSQAALQPSMAQDFFTYLPWVLLTGVVVVAALHIFRLRRGENTKRDKLLKRAIGEGGKPDGVQHPTLSRQGGPDTPDSYAKDEFRFE